MIPENFYLINKERKNAEKCKNKNTTLYLVWSIADQQVTKSLEKVIPKEKLIFSLVEKSI